MAESFIDPSLKKKKKKKVVQFNEDPLGAEADPTQARASLSPVDDGHVQTMHEQMKAKLDAVAGTGGEGVGEEDPAAMFGDLKKKKKKKDVKADSESTPDPAPSVSTANATPAEAEGSFDLGELKKKKKKKVPVDMDAFETELAASKGGEDDDEADEILELDEDDEDLGENPFVAGAVTGGGEINMLEPGREPWAGSDRDYKYPELLDRFYILLHAANPALASNMGKRYTIAPPQLMREGNKKSIFTNITDISRKMHREPSHVISFMLAEMGTTGSVDGSGRLVIKGRFLGKQIENVLRRYIVEYVTCKTCKSPDTLLTKENRIDFMMCESCGSRRSVSAIKSGFKAQIGKRKKIG